MSPASIGGRLDLGCIAHRFTYDGGVKRNVFTLEGTGSRSAFALRIVG
jgi:hypothetical protein